MEIQLACDCKAVAEPLDRGGVIIDVSASDEPEIASEPVSLPRAEPLVLPGLQTRKEFIEPLVVEEQENKETQSALANFRLSLLENIGRSASLSLVDLESELPEVDTKNQPAASSRKDELNGLKQFTESGRVRVTSALEAAIQDDRLKPADPKPQMCPRSSRFEITGWATDAPFVDQIGPARNAILGEFDAPELVAARSLARLYIHFGLGAEARAVLAQFELSFGDSQAIEALSQIVDPSIGGQSGSLAPYMKCDALIAIWSVLDGADTRALADSKIKGIVAEFSAWPIHLRNDLGPKLVEALLQNDHEEAAGVVENVVARPEDAPDDALTMVSARQSEPDNFELQAVEEIISNDGEEAPEALVIYLNRVMDEGLNADPDLLELARAYSKELETLEIGARLRNVHLRGLAHSGRYEAAIADLKEAESGAFPLEPRLSEDILRKFLDGAGSDLIARLALHYLGHERFSEIDRKTSYDLAERLLNDGLPELSAEVLSASSIEGSPDVLAAQIEKARGNREIAEQILRQIGDEEADALRVTSLLEAGQAEAAWSELADRLPQNLSSQVAWAAAEWKNVDDDGPRGRVAQLLTEAEEPNFQTAPLTAARAFTANSRESRLALTELLGAATR
ncbi:MAG: hypothetical protein AAGA08_00920 [Pseudomonadota bacterium]